MRILIAEDDTTSRAVLSAVLQKHGHEVLAASDGLEAWELVQKSDAPRLIILDWMMPGMDGIEVCRRLRTLDNEYQPYVIFLTTLGDKKNVAAGLDAGANDYVVKPFDPIELMARVATGRRMIEMQDSLISQANELREALAHIRTLQDIIPICCVCKRVRDDRDYWESVEVYVSRHTDSRFSHGFCPDCLENYCRENELGDDKGEPVT